MPYLLCVISWKYAKQIHKFQAISAFNKYANSLLWMAWRDYKSRKIHPLTNTIISIVLCCGGIVFHLTYTSIPAFKKGVPFVLTGCITLKQMDIRPRNTIETCSQIVKLIVVVLMVQISLHTSICKVINWLFVWLLLVTCCTTAYVVSYF